MSVTEWGSPASRSGWNPGVVGVGAGVEVPFAFRVWHTYDQIVRTPKANGTIPAAANLPFDEWTEVLG